jgi:hypothetical protein
MKWRAFSHIPQWARLSEWLGLTVVTRQLSVLGDSSCIAPNRVDAEDFGGRRGCGFANQLSGSYWNSRSSCEQRQA